jgi:hypothetical protein
LLSSWQSERNLSTLSRDSPALGSQADNPKRTFDRTQQTQALLGQLREVLSATIKACDDFMSLNGDIGYFLVVESETLKSQEDMRSSILLISKTMETMKGLKVTLERLEESCHKSAQAVSYFLLY